MESTPKPEITVKTTVATPLEKTWFLWTTPEHIMQWNSATPEWHTPTATNDLRVGGSFSYRMEARDGSFGFDFGGTYDQVKPYEMISYTLEDGRRVEVTFKDQAGDTEITEVFEAEETNPLEMQQTGWQAILDNFKQYAESVG